MFFWMTALGLSLIIAFFVFRPLVRHDAGLSLDAHAFDREVYKDQMSEVERDQAAGLLNEGEAEMARIEISRRLLKYADKDSGQVSSLAFANRDLVPFFGILVLTSFALYWFVGSPTLPDRPLASRQAEIENIRLAQQQSASSGLSTGSSTGRASGEAQAQILNIVAQAEAHLEANPDDGRGWEVIAPVYYRMGDLMKAQMAYAKTIELLGSTDLRHSSLGEVIVSLQEGQVTPEAKSHFLKALELNGDNPSANFFLALDLAQHGETDMAIRAFEAFASRSPADAHWIGAVRMQLAELKNIDVAELKLQTLPPEQITTPVDTARENSLSNTAAVNASNNGDSQTPLSGPTQEDIEAASDMSADDRMMMIRGMVASLDAKLTDEPNNFEGWQRLLRSYMVLEDGENAALALKRAMQAFPPNTQEGQALIELARSMDIAVDGLAQSDSSSATPLSGPTKEDIEAASDMSADDRMMMIRGMVASLDAKLTDEPNNFEGWQRLLRSYMVLEDGESAALALKRALQAFPPETGQGQALVAMAKQMNIRIDE